MTKLGAAALDTLTPDDKRRLLAELLRKRQASEPAAAAPVDRHAAFALNDMQQAFWVGRSGGAQLGNIAIHGYLEIACTDLDVARASAAFRALVSRHDMLRAVVAADGTQRVLPEVPAFEIAREDVTGLDAEQRAARLAELRAQLSHQQLDVQRWPLFDIRAVQTDARATLLLFSADLIIADTFSMVTLFREWARFYHEPRWAPAALSYSFQQYLADEQAFGDTQAYRRAEAYWTARLEQLPDAPRLPLRIDPSELTEPRFVRHAASLNAAQWSNLKQHARKHGLTPSVLMCTAYAEVLARWSGQPHFTLNVIPSTRRPLHPQVDQVVGPFSSINLLEVDLRPHRSFVERAQALQKQLLHDLDHMQYNGVKVLRKLAQQRRTGLHALMPVVFTSAPLELRDLEGLGRVQYMLSQTPQVWIDHQLFERDGSLLFNWDVVEALFPEGMIAEMFDALVRRLQHLADAPTAFVHDDVDILPEAGREARVRANATAAPLRELTLHELVLQQARRHPEREAVVCPARRMSFGELLSESQQLAQQLREIGVGPATVVAISFAKGWQQVVAALGVLRSGAAYLPLDPSLPVARRTQLLERAGCRVIVSTAEASADLPPELRAGLVELGASVTTIADAHEVSVSADALAYVIFTSGSTGTPKGVMLTHRAVLNTLDDINERFDVGPDDRVLALSSLSFDLSVYDIFGVLGRGGCVVLPAPGSERDPAHWLERMQRERVSLWSSVPALWRLLSEHAGRSCQLPALRLILLSGDWIALNVRERTRAIAPHAKLISLGGATEAAIWSIHHPIELVEPGWTSIPYGKPLRNQRFHVRSPTGEDCPTWVPGELYIAGAGLALGYLGEPERTAQSFIVDPRSGERLYRTGDFGRYLPDGSIEFLGRHDAQVKVGGHRIELGEIEARLLECPELRAATVRALGGRYDKRLVAYVVGASASTSIASSHEDNVKLRASVRAQLSRALPEYMVPRQIFVLDALPLTANGKLDIAALPTEELPLTAPSSEQAACGHIERAIIQTWEEVLQRAPIDPTANFFELGGDSLLMVRARQKLAQSLARELTIVELYAHPSPRALACHLAQASADGADSAGPAALTASTSAARSRAALRRRALGGMGDAR